MLNCRFSLRNMFSYISRIFGRTRCRLREYKRDKTNRRWAASVTSHVDINMEFFYHQNSRLSLVPVGFCPTTEIKVVGEGFQGQNYMIKPARRLRCSHTLL